MEKLSTLKIGEKAKIKSFDSHSKTRNILLSFGLYNDAVVEIIRMASFEDPICVRINNRLIAIRKKQAQLILIEKL
jgi:ferrous iron transport protein A